MMKIKKILPLIILFVSAGLVYSQTTENWVPVTIDSEGSLYINVTGLSSFQGNEFYVWTLEETKKPITIDEVDGDIYKTRTYYLFNKQSGRYSILQIIYYDEKDNVLKSYSYNVETDNPDFRFNHPLFKNSDIEKVYQKCIEIINEGKPKKQ
ncbi:MAG: hypothetical protein M1495_15590 [Bacteroidetes bacterium]|nr:hypothetical protein [Bacteroidota bacterium]